MEGNSLKIKKFLQKEIWVLFFNFSFIRQFKSQFSLPNACFLFAIFNLSLGFKRNFKKI